MATEGDGVKGGNGQGDDASAGKDKDVNVNINVSGDKGDSKGDLGDKDTSKFNDDQKNDYIDKLKDENARRRIANKKKDEELDKMKTSQADMQKKLDTLLSEKTERENKDKDLSDKEKSEIERIKTRMSDMEKSISEKEGEISTLKSSLTVKEREVQKRTRENTIDRLVRAKGVAFSSDYERNGFIGDLLKTNANGDFEKNEEEVIYEVNQFIKSRGKSPDTPGGGPMGKMSDTPLATEIQGLLAKESLTAEESKRLDEILEEVNKKVSGA